MLIYNYLSIYSVSTRYKLGIYCISVSIIIINLTPDYLLRHVVPLSIYLTYSKNPGVGPWEKPVRFASTRLPANLRGAFASKSVPHRTGSGVHSSRACWPGPRGVATGPLPFPA